MGTPGSQRTARHLLLATLIAILLQCISLSHAADTLPKVAALFTTTPSNGTDARCSSMKIALDHYMIPYTEIIVPEVGITGPLPLHDANDNPKYFLIVVCVGQLPYQNSTNSWVSAVTDEQWSQLRTYELKNSVRRVTFDVYPPTVPGMKLANVDAPGCCPVGIEQPLRWYPTDTLAELGMSVDVLNPASFETKSLYHYPAAVGGDTNGTTIHPFLKFDPLPPDYGTETVAAVVVNDETRQQMIFFMAFASWSATSAYLDDAWIQWGTRNNTYTGYGRKIEGETNIKSGGQNADNTSNSHFILNKTTAAYLVIMLSLTVSFQQF